MVVRGARRLAGWVLCLAHTTRSRRSRSDEELGEKFHASSSPALNGWRQAGVAHDMPAKGVRVGCIGSSD